MLPPVAMYENQVIPKGIKKNYFAATKKHISSIKQEKPLKVINNQHDQKLNCTPPRNNKSTIPPSSTTLCGHPIFEDWLINNSPHYDYLYLSPRDSSIIGTWWWSENKIWARSLALNSLIHKSKITTLGDFPNPTSHHNTSRTSTWLLSCFLSN